MDQSESKCMMFTDTFHPTYLQRKMGNIFLHLEAKSQTYFKTLELQQKLVLRAADPGGWIRKQATHFPSTWKNKLQLEVCDCNEWKKSETVHKVWILLRGIVASNLVATTAAALQSRMVMMFFRHRPETRGPPASPAGWDPSAPLDGALGCISARFDG